MELLQGLAQIGLPGWLMSIAALLVIFHYVGLLKWIGDFLHSRQAEDQEDRKLDRNTRARQLDRQQQIENQALEIAKENIDWARKDFSVMQRTVESQARLLEHLRDEIRILAGALAKLTDEIEELGRTIGEWKQ